MTPPAAGCRTPTGPPPAATAVAGAALLAVLGLAGCGGTATSAQQDRPGQVTDAFKEQLSQEAFDRIEVGARKEQVLSSLRPAAPLATRVLERYRQRDPATIKAACVYYAQANQSGDGLYQLCFDQDVLVDKSVVPGGLAPPRPPA